MLKHHELASLKADLAAVNALLASRSEYDDPIGHLQLSERKVELESQIKALVHDMEQQAMIALFFGGRPVVGSRGILADFAGKMLEIYQDMVNKRYASAGLREPLGSRGTVPMRASAQMLVTEVTRGSFGFVLEEAELNKQMVETPLKHVVSEVSDIIVNLSQENEEGLDTLAETLDDRLLVSLRGFFKTLDDAGATVKLVDGHREFVLDREDIERARTRADSIALVESEIEEKGILYMLPNSRRFEFQPEPSGDLKKGSITPNCLQDILDKDGRIPGHIIGTRLTARFQMRTITQRTGAIRISYNLVRISSLP